MFLISLANFTPCNDSIFVSRSVGVWGLAAKALMTAKSPVLYSSLISDSRVAASLPSVAHVIIGCL